MEKNLIIRIIYKHSVNEKALSLYRIRGSLGSFRLGIREISGIRNLGLSRAIEELVHRYWDSKDELSSCEYFEDPEASVIAEVVHGRRSLVVFGAGHVGRSVALMGSILGMNVSLLDDRPEFLTKDLMPVCGVELSLCSFNDIGDVKFYGRDTAVVVVTRGHQSDEELLKQMVDRELGYIGMIGSKRRVHGVFRRLRQGGVSQLFINSVKAPIGLDIGAVTPQEIAVAIHAEIIKCLNNQQQAQGNSASET